MYCAVGLVPQGPAGATLLHSAVRTGSLPLCALLVQHGADCRAADQDGASALDVAVASGRNDLARVRARAR